MSRASSSRVRFVFDVALTVAMLSVTGFVVWLLVRQPPTATPGPSRVDGVMSIETAPMFGDPQAPIVIVVFSDFECQYCARFARELWPELKARWIDTGEVQVAFRHLPLPAHAAARRAAEAAECAGRQGRFWPMHDAIFAGHQGLRETDLLTYAAAADLDVDLFNRCMQGDASSRVVEDLALAASLGLDRTPAFLIGPLQADRRVNVVGELYGALPLEQFEKAINAVRTR